MLVTYPFNISKALNDEHKSFLVVAHATQQEHHLWNKIALLASAICLVNCERR